MNRDKDIALVFFATAITLAFLIIFVSALLVVYKNRQARYTAWAKEAEAKFSREILLAQLEIREQTLKNISEELHDNMGQVLSLVVLNLSAIEFADTVSDEVRLHNSIDLVQKVVAGLRDLSGTMDAGSMLRAGLPEVMRQELVLLEKTGKFRTVFQCTGLENRFDSSRETIIYRIFQEGMTNVIKHARATELSVSIQFFPEEVRLYIADNGIGFDQTAVISNAQQKSGSGLANMRKRAALVGGTLVVKSGPSQGTTILLTIPMDDK
jgi:two-component system, NarL family, sensor kinase